MMRLTLAAATLALSLLAGCGDTSAPTDPISAATAQIAKGEHGAATITLKNLLREQPDQAAARELLGRVYLLLGQPESAVKEFERARSLGVNTPELRVALLQARLLARQYDQALDETPAPGDADASADLLAGRAEALVGLDRRDEAKATLEAAIKLDPDASFANLGLVRFALQDNDLSRADDILKRLESKHPELLNTWLLRGDLETRRGRAAAAAEAYRQALTIAPGYPNARVGLVRALLGDHQLKEARTELKPLKAQFGKQPAVLYLDGLSRYLTGDVAGAQDQLRVALSIEPRHVQSNLLLAQIFYQQGKLEQAADMMGPVLNTYPDYPQARKLYAAIKLRQQNPDAALEAISALDEVSKADPSVLALAGSAHFSKKDYAAGLESYGKAAASAPSSETLKTRLALARIAAGETAAGMAELERLAADKSFGEADLSLIRMHMRDREFDALLADADRLEETLPDSPMPANMRALAFIGKNDPAAARTAFEAALVKDPKFVPALVNLARLALEDNDIKLARKHFEAALAIEPANAEALTGLAILQAAKGELEAAVGSAEKAREAVSGLLPPRLVLTELYLQVGRYKDAVTVARESQAIAPRDGVVLIALGRALLGVDEVAQAVDVLEAVSKVAPDDVRVLTPLTEAYARAGRLDDANKTLTAALKARPEDPALLAAAARLALQAGETERAQALLTALEKHAPDSAFAAGVRADLLLAAGQAAQAVTEFEKAQRLAPSSQYALGLFRALSRAGELARGVKLLEAWRKEHPGDVVAAVALANGYEAAGRTKEAISAYEAVLQKAPDTVAALNNLALLYHAEGDARALETAEKAVQLAPGDGRVADTLGWILIELGRYERAASVLREAVNGAPDIPTIRYHLAQALMRSGDIANANAEVDKALASTQPFPERAQAEELKKLM